MNKLTYTKIANDTISIDLHNGYTVVAMELFNYDAKKYEVTFYLKDNNINMLDLIERMQNTEFDTTYKNINSAILKYVATSLSNGDFNYYINRYDYMMKCFDKGNSVFETEWLKKY
jgi:hypothetical protein